MAEMTRGHLHPGTLPHVESNIGNCFADPGPLTSGEALRGELMHQYCSPRCRVRPRIAEALSAPASVTNAERGSG